MAPIVYDYSRFTTALNDSFSGSKWIYKYIQTQNQIMFDTVFLSDDTDLKLLMTTLSLMTL